MVFGFVIRYAIWPQYRAPFFLKVAARVAEAPLRSSTGSLYMGGCQNDGPLLDP